MLTYLLQFIALVALDETADERRWLHQPVFRTKASITIQMPDGETHSLFGTDFQVVGLKGGRVRVRDQRGVEGWIAKDEVVPLDEAVEFFSSRLKEATDKHNLFMRGAAWYRKGNLNQAIMDFSEAIRLEPCAVYYTWRGVAYCDQQEFEKAVADHTEAIRLDAKDPIAPMNRAIVWFHKQDYDKAIADYTDAVEKAPEFALVYCNRGIAWLYKKDTEKALADFNRAIELDGRFAEAFVCRTYVWEDRKKYDRQLEDCESAIRLNPLLASPYAIRAWVWAACPDGKYRDGAKAVNSATKACELSQRKDWSSLAALAAGHAECGDFRQAVETIKEALPLAPAVYRAKCQELLKCFEMQKPYREDT